MKFGKGWRTVGINALVLGLGAANVFGVDASGIPGVTDLVAAADPKVLAVGLPIVNILLRSITTTPVGKPAR
jgi:hypothetical protein